jgi:hypothetical protein
VAPSWDIGFWAGRHPVDLFAGIFSFHWKILQDILIVKLTGLDHGGADDGLDPHCASDVRP